MTFQNIQYNTITLFKEGSAITYYSFLTYGPQKVSSRFIFVFALSQFSGPDYLGADYIVT